MHRSRHSLFAIGDPCRSSTIVNSGCEIVNNTDDPRPPQNLEDWYIYGISLVRIVFCHGSTNLSLHCFFYVTKNILFFFWFSIARDVVTVLLLFVDIYHFNCTFPHAHIEAHTHMHTCVIGTQEELRQPGTEAWLEGAEERVLLETKDSVTLESTNDIPLFTECRVIWYYIFERH